MKSNQIKQQEFQYDVFFSYKSELQYIVEQLVEWFEKDNAIRCWYASRNLDRSGAGKEYDDEIVSAINNARCMVVVLNDDALNSKWVKREVNHAEKKDKTIIPFAVSELTVDNGLRMRLDTSHFIAAYPDLEEKFPFLLKNVKLILGQDVSGIKIQDESIFQVKSYIGIDLDYDNGLALLEVGDDKEAFLAFLRSVVNGNKNACEKLVEIALRNKRNAQFLEDGIWEQIEELSDQGEGFADLLLHFKYYSMGTQNEVAIKYLKRSIQKYDSPISYLQLGICYGWGLGVPLNDVLAKRNYEKAMEKGCGIACRYLGQLYRYGGVKVEKDIVKAEEYLRKGVGMGVAECYEQLFWLYFEIGEDKKAKDLAQQMIDYNIKGGYSLMGNYYSSTFNQNQAEDWYKEAAKREENNAWGNLAWMYLQHGDKDEAYRLADKGCSENDSFSFQMLGHLCKIDGELNKAWSYFHQSILKFGTGQYGLAELYFDSNYLPEGYTLSELKHELEQSARKQDMKSIEYTLRLILLENKKDCANISYDSLKDLPDSYEFIRLGAKEGDANCLYILGRLLIESEGKMHNPFKGIDNIMSALEKGNKEASEYLFNTRSNLRTTELSRLYQDIVKNKAYVGKETATVIEHYGEYDLPFIEWLYRSLKNLVWDDTNVFFDCFIVFRKALEKTKSQIEVKNWLDMQIEEFVNGFDDKTTSKLCTPFYAYLLATRLSIADEIDNGTILSIIRDVIKIYEDIEFVSKIHYFKDTVQLIWPDYRADKILDGDFSSNRDLWIFYGINNRSIPDVLVGDSSAVSEINDYFGQYVHLPFEMHGLNVTKSKKFLFAYTKMTNCYQKLKDTRKVLKLEESDYRIRKTSVCCSIGDTLNYCINSFKMLVVSRNAFSKQWQDIVDNLDDPEHLHNIANTVKNINARNLLYSYLDLISARDELLMFDIQLEHCISNAYISDTINAMIFELEINKIQHSIPRMTEDGIPESIKEMKDAMRTFAGTLRHYLTA